MRGFIHFLDCECGITASEYAAMLGLLIAAALVAIFGIGVKLDAGLDVISKGLPGGFLSDQNHP
jgi:Flp pilus assembly pilin Flp